MTSTIAKRALLEVKNLTKSFGLGPLRQRVLENCSFGLQPERLTVLIGPSGCGKSTLVNILAGYEAPDGGEVKLFGGPVSGPSAERLVVFQETALFPWMTTFQNVIYGPLVQRSKAREEIEADAVVLLEHVGLKDFRDKYPSQLSGGMQRRAELARAIINNPSLMMLDEPFRGLVAMTRDLMQEYFLKLYESRRQSVFFVTSEIEEAIFLADQLLIMTNRPGQIIKTLNVDLPRPRTASMLISTEYLRYKDEALEVLHSEAVKAFAEGSKAAADFLEAYADQNKN